MSTAAAVVSDNANKTKNANKPLGSTGRVHRATHKTVVNLATPHEKNWNSYIVYCISTYFLYIYLRLNCDGAWGAALPPALE